MGKLVLISTVKPQYYATVEMIQKKVRELDYLVEHEDMTNFKNLQRMRTLINTLQNSLEVFYKDMGIHAVQYYLKRLVDVYRLKVSGDSLSIMTTEISKLTERFINEAIGRFTTGMLKDFSTRAILYSVEKGVGSTALYKISANASLTGIEKYEALMEKLRPAFADGKIAFRFFPDGTPKAYVSIQDYAKSWVKTINYKVMNQTVWTGGEMAGLTKFVIVGGEMADCPICGPYRGKVWDRADNVPLPPYHPGCTDELEWLPPERFSKQTEPIYAKVGAA